MAQREEFTQNALGTQAIEYLVRETSWNFNGKLYPLNEAPKPGDTGLDWVVLWNLGTQAICYIEPVNTVSSTISKQCIEFLSTWSEGNFNKHCTCLLENVST